VGIGSLNKESRRAVFLDRDGVLNQAILRNGKPYPPQYASEVEILPGVYDSLVRLKEQGFLLLVTTNQPDVRTGKQSREVVKAIHSKLRSELPLDDVFVCYHIDEDHCGCRKPAPGMIQQAKERYHLHLPSCFMVGDRWRDVDAGHRAGCQSILVDYGYEERGPEREPAVRVASLSEAAAWILGQLEH
jgi:D-glycero-D-manno-heptose 1,7-bisphosphate phosphatase